MKKLLVLMLVLGVTSLASAALTLQISVNDEKNPVDSQYIITTPSCHLDLDIWTTADITPGVGEGFLALTVQTSGATISGGAVAYPGEPGLAINDDAAGTVGIPPLPVGEQGVWGMIALSTLSLIPAGSTLFDDIEFHCEALTGDLTITLWDCGVGLDQAVYMDSVIVHQIPEPASMLLLGLGGLLLRRRK